VLSRWKQEFIERSSKLFEDNGFRNKGEEQRIAELERLVGWLAMELEMAKKVSRLLGSPSNENGR